MKRFSALLATTWWLWLLFAAITAAGWIWIDPVFVVCIPICVVTFLYFAFVRFDEDGNRRTIE